MSNKVKRSTLAAILCLFGVGVSMPLYAAETAPSGYNAYTGTDTKTIPPAPALGPANSVIIDPTFGSRILRVTDQNTSAGRSFISTDAGFHRTWNADSTAIKLTGPQGDGYWMEFNPSTFKVGDGSSRPAVHTLPFAANWEWSTIDPDVIYYLNGNKIAKYNKATGVKTDLGGPSTGEPVTYMAVVIGQDNWVCTAAGSGVQDSYTKIFCINPISPSVSKFIDVYKKQINGVTQGDPNWPTSAPGQVIGVHSISGGTGASWLEVTFHQSGWGRSSGSAFNLATNTWSLLTDGDIYWSGHVSMGNGRFANASGSVDGRDSRGMLLRNPDLLMNSSEYRFIGQPPNTNNGWCDADHSSWFNSLTNPSAPILQSRYTSAACPYAWTGELLAMAVDGSNTVWRFAHTHMGNTQCYFSDGFAQISNDGKWALFSSYWDAKLGAESGGFGCGSRIDTFIVDLMSAGSTNTSSPPSGTTGDGTPTTPPPPDPTTTTTAPVRTRIEENGGGVIYSGSWFPNVRNVHSGGSAVLAMDIGSRATLNFTGTAVTWIAYRDPWSGIANVYVDGTLKGTVDTYAASDTAQSTIYTVTGLTSGSHTLVIEATGRKSALSGGAWVWIDAFDITSGGSTSTATTTTTTTNTTPTDPTPAPTTTTTPTGTLYRVEQSSPALQWSGSWFPNNGTFNSGGSATLAMDVGSRVSFTFTGTSITWIAYRDQWSGIARVYLDGALKASVDTYSLQDKARNPVYSISGLAWGSHTITVEVTGTKRPASGGKWIWVDAFDYVGAQ